LIQSKGDGKLVAVDREGHEVSMCPCGKTHYPMGKIAKKQSVGDFFPANYFKICHPRKFFPGIF